MSPILRYGALVYLVDLFTPKARIVLADSEEGRSMDAARDPESLLRVVSFDTEKRTVTLETKRRAKALKGATLNAS